MNQKIIAVLLIAAGVAIFSYQGITYTTREKALDLGPLQITAEKTHNIPLPPILGGMCLVGGLLMLVFGNKHLS